MFDMDFITACVKGHAGLRTIDDYIDAWHAGKAGVGQELHEFLGMAAAEYAMWVERPEILPFIVDARRFGKSVQEVILDAERQPANGARDAAQLHDWLISTHRLAA